MPCSVYVWPQLERPTGVDLSRVKPTSLRHFPTHCENGSGAGTGPWRLNTSREDFRFSLVHSPWVWRWWSEKKYNSLTSPLRGARRLSFAPGEGSWTRTKKPIKAPDLLSVSLAVSVLEPKHIFVRFRCVYHSANPLIFINLISLLTFVILSITFNHIQSVGRHGLSIG